MEEVERTRMKIQKMSIIDNTEGRNHERSKSVVDSNESNDMEKERTEDKDAAEETIASTMLLN